LIFLKITKFYEQFFTNIIDLDYQKSNLKVHTVILNKHENDQTDYFYLHR
jgi:hypothetical protein